MCRTITFTVIAVLSGVASSMWASGVASRIRVPWYAQGQLFVSYGSGKWLHVALPSLALT